MVFMALSPAWLKRYYAFRLMPWRRCLRAVTTFSLLTQEDAKK